MFEAKKCRIAIVGVGQRGGAYLRLCKDHPDAELVALCDLSAERLNCFATRHGYGEIARYTELERMLDECPIDGLIVTVPDFAHKAAALSALKRRCAVMLEKPMAPAANDCREILRAWQNSGAVMQLGFVLRAHPFYRKLKELVSAGAIGELLSIEADESLGVMHGASYMRRWHRKSANSGGFLLAKCSHDLDLLSYLAGARPSRVSSFGSLGFFVPAKRKAQYCSRCPDAACRFRFRGEMVAMTDAESADPTVNGFDLCVYNDDKDVVDRQTVMLEFPNQVCATFSLNLFAAAGKRTIKLNGSDGTLEGNTADAVLTLTRSNGEVEHINCQAANSSGHGGSDLLFFNEFLDCIRTGNKPQADAFDGLAATVVGNAVERARLNGTVETIAPSEYQL